MSACKDKPTLNVLEWSCYKRTPGAVSGHFRFGIGSMLGGSFKAQALFTIAPVSLVSVGERLSLMAALNKSEVLTIPLSRTTAPGIAVSLYALTNSAVMNRLGGVASGAG